MPCVNFDQLKVFRDIAKARSVTRGAEMNGISQSAASQHVQELERSMGTELLDRSTRPLRLTPAGKIYYDFCRETLRRKEEFDAALDRLRRTVDGCVRVACIYSVGISEMSRLEARFRRDHPDAELLVEYLRPEKVYEAVIEDRADIGLVSYPEASKETKVIPWRDEVMVVAAPPNHPLSVNTFLAAEQLKGMDYVGFDEDLPIARELRRFFRDHGVQLNVVMHFDNVNMIKEAVALGTGISILPERVIRTDIAQERLLGIPFESPGLYRPLGVIHRRRKRFNRATRAFLETLERSVEG